MQLSEEKTKYGLSKALMNVSDERLGKGVDETENRVTTSVSTSS
jgi:hypothetical protein